MKLVDLTQVLRNGMPVYPGTEGPRLEIGCSIEKDGFEEKRITMFSHTGTHMDAPAHLIYGAPTLDALPVSAFYGKAVLYRHPDGGTETISLRDLGPVMEAVGSADFLVIRTGWSRFWGQERYYAGFPTLTTEAAARLASTRLKGVALDCISADRADTVDYEVHKILLSRGMVIVENLTGLDALPGTFGLSCFPLKIESADGSPVRAVAYVED